MNKITILDLRPDTLDEKGKFAPPEEFELLAYRHDSPKQKIFVELPAVAYQFIQKWQGQICDPKTGIFADYQDYAKKGVSIAFNGEKQIFRDTLPNGASLPIGTSFSLQLTYDSIVDLP